MPTRIAPTGRMAHAGETRRRGIAVISPMHRPATVAVAGRVALPTITVQRATEMGAITVRPTQAVAQVGVAWVRSTTARLGRTAVVHREAIRPRRVRPSQVRITNGLRADGVTRNPPTAVAVAAAGEAVIRSLRSRHRNGRISNHRNPATTTAGVAHRHTAHPATVPRATVHQVHPAVREVAAVVTRAEAEAHAGRGKLMWFFA